MIHKPLSKKIEYSIPGPYGMVMVKDLKQSLQNFLQSVAANVSEKRNIIELGKIVAIAKIEFGEDLVNEKK